MPSRTQGGTIVLDQDMYNKLMAPSGTSEVDPFCINPISSFTQDGKTMPLFKLVPATLKDLLQEETETFGAGDDDKEPWIVGMHEITTEELIGNGTFGDVYSGRYRGRKVAIKKFVRQKVTGQLTLEIRTECAILRYLLVQSTYTILTHGLQRT